MGMPRKLLFDDKKHGDVIMFDDMFSFSMRIALFFSCLLCFFYTPCI